MIFEKSMIERGNDILVYTKEIDTEKGDREVTDHFYRDEEGLIHHKLTTIDTWPNPQKIPARSLGFESRREDI